MRRWPALIGVAVTLSVAGCTEPPPDTDGALTDDWGRMPVARQFRPADHTCHDAVHETTNPDTYAPIPCAGRHVAETFFVGDLPAQAESRTARTQAYAACSWRASTFAGADWHTGWLALQTVLPGTDAWAGGARWFRCDLGELDPDRGGTVQRTGTLRRAMVTRGGLVMRCFNPVVADGDVGAMHPAACAATHTAEFAGLWQAPAGAFGNLSTARIEQGCDTVIAKFAAVPADKDLPSRTGWLGFPPGEQMWQLGDHSVQCFLWLNGEKMTGSYRKAGPAKLKIHYIGH
jgi:putative regulator of septum formation